MNVITTSTALAEFCARAKSSPYLTVDTEFIRENSYFAELCLLQLAYKGEGAGTSAVVDVLAEGIDLAPVLELFRDQSIVKVFHAARQDLEIFYHDFGVLPQPFFDTQIGAMVAGFGDQVGYETLVKSIVRAKVDKSSRFTDWRRRPLSEAQIEYARADVTHLRIVYEFLIDKLEKTGRRAWVEEELEALLDPALYDVNPREAWKRVRTRTATPRFLATVRELAAFREEFARDRNIPRSRVFKDDALLEIAAQRPKSLDDLRKLRAFPREARKGVIAEGALKAIATAEAMDKSEWPTPAALRPEGAPPESVLDLLRVYLKAQSERHEVAMRLIASSAELSEFIADPNGAHPLNHGWRKDVFGNGAKELIAGKAALAPNGKYVELVKL